MMMTNNYVFQGQKYTNGVGAVPQRMMGSAPDVMFLTDGASHFVNCVQLERARTLGVPANGSAIVWQQHYCQGSVLHQRGCYTAND